jgi:UDP-N-acetylglucosamine transferase subunit ALG13
MIFVTVGTQLPFDRLVRTVDEWAGRIGRRDVFAQIGPSGYRPQHVQWADFLAADECRRRIEAARVVVAHAGMGSILTALELGKPIIVMPRRSDLREHRNDHQVSTARRFLAQGRIDVAFDEAQLTRQLEEVETLSGQERIAPTASPRLLHALAGFVNFGTCPAGTSCVGDVGADAAEVDRCGVVPSSAAGRQLAPAGLEGD